MNVLILGDGPEEWSWAAALDEQADHRLVAACPGFKARSSLPGGPDLDDALAIPGIDAVIVGGDPALRAEGLRRAAAAGLPVIVLHPPGPNADPYYHVALSRQETGAVVVPDLPGRRHPGVAALEKALGDGPSRVLRLEATVGPGDVDLLDLVFPRVIDLVRAVLGEVEAVTATGDPPGDRPTERLVVQARGPRGRRAEVRLERGPPGPSRLTVAGAEGSITLEFEPDSFAPSRLLRRSVAGSEVVTDLDAWDPKAAILDTLAGAVAGQAVHPDLLDGTRAMELAEATARSLRRGRTVDLFYEEMSEAGNFKSVMTSTGCGLLLATLLILPVAAAGQALGLGWMAYLPWALPPLLILFALLQVLRLGIRRTGDQTRGSKASGT